MEKVGPVVGTHPYPLNELLLMTATVCWLRPSVVRFGHVYRLVGPDL
jgi:hypothetical protein